jgi:hypothetical protein
MSLQYLGETNLGPRLPGPEMGPHHLHPHLAGPARAGPGPAALCQQVLRRRQPCGAAVSGGEAAEQDAGRDVRETQT